MCSLSAMIRRMCQAQMKTLVLGGKSEAECSVPFLRGSAHYFLSSSSKLSTDVRYLSYNHAHTAP